MGLKGLGLEVWALGFGAWGLGLGVWGLGLGAWGATAELARGALRMDVKPDYWMPVQEQEEAQKRSL